MYEFLEKEDKKKNDGFLCERTEDDAFYYLQESVSSTASLREAGYSEGFSSANFDVEGVDHCHGLSRKSEKQ